MAKKKGTLKSRLKALQSAWADSEPQRAGASVPDDNYACRIESAVVEEAKSSGRLQIHYDLVVIDNEDFEGRKIQKYDGIDTEENLPYAQGTLEALELEIPDDIEDIGETLEEAAGLVVDVTVATRDEFTNIYFNELLEGYEEEEEEEEEKEEKKSKAKSKGKGKGKKAKKEEEPEEEEEEEEAEDLTEDDINDMKRKALLTLIEDEDIDIDPDDYKKLADLKEAVIEEYFEE